MDETNLMGEFGATLRARRRQLGLLQAELADLAGVSERSIRAIEQGKSTIRIDKLAQVLEAVGLRLTVERR